MLIVLLLCTGIDMIGDMPNRGIKQEEPVVSQTVVPEQKPTVPEAPKVVKKPVKKKEVSEVKPKEAAEKPKPAPKPEQKPEPEEAMIPVPEDDKLEPGEKEVEAKDTSEDGYKYYVYRSHKCGPCTWLVNELQKNVDEKDLILSYERTTKSGQPVIYVPVLEVYKDGKLVHQQVGYTSWETIQRKVSEAH